MWPAWLLGLAALCARGRSAPLRPLHVLLYTRQGCHLCEIAWRQLRTAQRKHQFILEQIDIDAEPELAARFSSLVPVVMINGKLRFRGGTNPVLLNRLLRAERDKAIKEPEKRTVPRCS